MFKKFLNDKFISGHHNDHEPHLLSLETLSLFSLMALFVFTGSVFVHEGFLKDVPAVAAIGEVNILGYVYVILGMLVFLALTLLFVTQIHRHHVKMGFRAASFIALLIVSAIIYKLII